MKERNIKFGGLLACMALLAFASCSNNAQAPQNAAASDTQAAAQTGAGTLKIAYIEIDTLLSKYDLWVTMNKEMLSKEENIRATLNAKAKNLQEDYEDFQRKLQNNAYATRERAEEEQARIIKKDEELKKLQERLSNEMAAELQKNNTMFRDSINAFLKDYNATRGYSLIISRVGDNLLVADEAMNITDEVLEGLNARYAASLKK